MSKGNAAQAEHQLLIQWLNVRPDIFLPAAHTPQPPWTVWDARSCPMQTCTPHSSVRCLDLYQQTWRHSHVGYLKLSGLGAGPRLADLMRLPGDGSRAFWKFFSIAINVCRPGLYRFCILRLEPIVLCLLVSVRSWLHSTRPKFWS